MGNSYSTLATRSHELATALLVLQHPLRDGQLGEFRKLINTFVGNDNDLFHNHQSRQHLHYRYPMVQYKTIDGKAAVQGIGPMGVSALHSLRQQPAFAEQCSLWLGSNYAITTEVNDTLLLHDTLQNTYHLRKYLALNDRNIAVWNTSPALVKRTQLVEQCLVGHILKWASAMGWLLPHRSLEVAITEMRPFQTTVHGASFLALELDFQTNITLPEHIGLGKAVSLGFGTATTVK